MPTVEATREPAVAPGVALGAPGPRRRRPPVFVALAAAFAILVLGLAMIGPIIANDAARRVSIDASLLSPSGSHPLGTDDLGRDVLARLVVGARTALIGPLLITVLTAVLSTVIGLFAGYFGGWFDAVVSRLVDVVYSLPALLVAIVVVGVLGGGYALAIAVLVALAVPYNVRYIRVATLEQRGRPYVEAARGLGLSRTAIAARHVLPNLTTVIISTVALRFTFAVVDLSTISFLGLGVPPGTPDWGRMLSDSRATVFDTPWPMLGPLVMIALTVVSANALGDWLHGKAIDRGRGE